ncbi:DegV family protein [Natroniella sulfidigena]|uniref:DegV family protein n=1 Tax=Natroniella sulfidigena TaxID=723921 RepID=UPI00200AD5B2|nr:DegV family protein [Natroniella sulfidigena]MCK8818149.1 DegV family protein [Natroniella sulfidigena]
MKIAVVTDSTADLTAELLKEYNITMVPLEVNLAGKSYLDKIDISPDQFLDLIEKSDDLPTTSQPAVGKFVEVYEELAKDYDQIISIHISEKLSGTIESARLAADMIEGIEIKIVDSKKATLSLGVMVMEVAKAIKGGSNLEEIMADLIPTLKEDIEIYFAVDDLSYLEKGGRIGKASAFLGNLFNISPILTLEDGVVTPYGKVRGQRRLYNEFNKLVTEKLEGQQGSKLIVLHGKYRDKADQLKENLIEQFEWAEEVEMMQFGPVIAAHVGPTPFGIVFLK